MRADPVVRLRGLEKHFGERRALTGIDLDIADRQIFGVVGPDGAGKTTLLRTLAGLLEVTATHAEVLGIDLLGPVRELKRQVGYVPQSFGLHRNLSVAENLRFTARLHRVPPAEFSSRSRELLEKTGLAPFADRPAGALSGGMRQLGRPPRRRQPAGERAARLDLRRDGPVPGLQPGDAPARSRRQARRRRRSSRPSR